MVFIANAAHAQTPAADTLPAVTIDERGTPPSADVSGFGDLPLKDVPISAVLNRCQPSLLSRYYGQYYYGGGYGGSYGGYGQGHGRGYSRGPEGTTGRPREKGSA